MYQEEQGQRIGTNSFILGLISLTSANWYRSDSKHRSSLENLLSLKKFVYLTIDLQYFSWKIKLFHLEVK